MAYGSLHSYLTTLLLHRFEVYKTYSKYKVTKTIKQDKFRKTARPSVTETSRSQINVND